MATAAAPSHAREATGADRAKIQDLQRLAAKQAACIELLEKVARVANGAENAKTAIEACLDTLCDFTGWPLGHAYLAESMAGTELVSLGQWRCEGQWRDEDSARFAKLMAATQAGPVIRGEGIVGRVWQTKEPELVLAISPKGAGRRLEAARQAGLRAAFVLPIVVDDKVAAILELFTSDTQSVGDFESEAVVRSAAVLGPVIKRLQTELLLRDNEAVIRLAQKAAGVGFWIWNSRRDETFLSPELMGMLGLPTDKGLVVTDEDYLERFVDPSDRARLREVYIEEFEATPHFDILYRIRCADDRRLWVRETCEAIRDFSGAVGRAVGVVQDITNFKTVESELLHAKEAAEAASDAKSLFLANVSHELRTPLNAIIGFSEIMEEEIFGPVGDERYRNYVADIRDSGLHLLKTINDVLDLSKVEAGRFEMHFESADFAVQVEQALRLIKGQRAFAKRRIDVILPEEPLVLIADRHSLCQIIVNLVSNACKFSLPPSPVRISATRLDDGSVTITVEDQGIGMTPTELELALSPFQQVDSSLSREYEGSGLGLPLVRAMVEQHGVGLSIGSVPGEGTRVSLLWPADRVVTEAS